LGVLGIGLLASVLTSIGFCDPLFWRAEWRALTFQEANRCSCEYYQKRGYGQTFEHYGENVSQVSVPAAVTNERIFDMKSIKDWFKHGLTHLTLSFVFALFGIDAALSAAATWITRQAQVYLGLSALPTHFYVLLGVLIFCAITLFAILILILHKSAQSNAQSSLQNPSPPSKLVIHSAFYGNTPENEVSVLPKLNSLPKDAFAIYVTNNNVDAEPAPNIPPKKRLRVRYSYGNDTVYETTSEESEWMVLPDPTDRKRIIS
jgi:hypothetical protein